MKRTATFVMLGLSLFASKRARGQAAPAPSSNGDVVVTGTRTPEQSQRATVKTDVVTREEAERRGATNVAEALQSQPGVQVNPGAYGYLGTTSPIQIQGLDLNRVLVLEDGEPVIGDTGGAIDLSQIPITDIARIEVVTGPTSALYGSSALGGVVNIVTAPPNEEGPSARARTEYRSYHGVVLEGAGAHRKKRTWVAVEAGFNRMDALTQDPLPDTQIPETSRANFGVRAGTSLTKDIDVQARVRWLHRELGGVESTVYPGLGRFESDTPEITNRYAAQVLETIRLDRKGSNLRLSLARQQTGDTLSTIPRGSPLSTVQRSNQALQSFEGTATFADGPRTWVTGARFEAQTLSQWLDQTSNDQGTLVTTATREVVPNTLASAAVYGQLQWKFGKALTVLPGIRAENHGKYGGVVAPRLAIAIRPTDSLTIRASAGRGFRTPSAEELGFDFDHSIYGYRVRGNPDLGPESSWGVNGDVTFKPDDHVTARGGVFANWVTDLIDIDLAGGETNGTVVTYSYKNFEKVRTMGAQGFFGYRLGKRFRADIAYDYLFARDDVNDVPLAARPAHTVTTSLLAVLPWKLESYARARFTSDAYVDETTRTPGYTSIDLRLGRTLWPSSQLYAGVLNLLDAHQTPGRVGDLRPPLGRVFYVGLRAAFPWEDR